MTDTGSHESMARQRTLTGADLAGWLAALALLAIGFSISFGRSLVQGRAGAEMTFDDVVYALDGFHRSREILDQGLVSALHSAVADAPHAPIATLIATVSALLGGASTWRIYVINAAVIAVLLVLVVRVAFRARWPIAIGAAGVVLASPLGYFCIDQFRPDPAYAISLALLAALFSRLRDAAGQSAFCGLAGALLLYLKPSVFGITLVVMAAGVAWCLVPLPGTTTGLRVRFASALRASWVFVLAGLPFWVLVFPAAYEYARENTRGANSVLWVQPGPLEAVWGSIDGAQGVVGLSVWACLACLALAVVIALVTKSPRVLVRSTVFFWLAAVVLLPLGYARMSAHFFGLMPMLLVMLGSLVALADAIPRAWLSRASVALHPADDDGPVLVRRGLAGLVVVSMMLVLGYLTPDVRLTPAGLMPPLSVNGRILSTILEACTGRPQCESQYAKLGYLPPILVAASAEIADASMEWEAVSSGWSGEISGLPLIVDVPDALASMHYQDYVVVLGPTAQYVNPRLPVNQIQDGLAAALIASPEWRALPVPVVGDRYLLFERVSGWA